MSYLEELKQLMSLDLNHITKEDLIKELMKDDSITKSITANANALNAESKKNKIVYSNFSKYSMINSISKLENVFIFKDKSTDLIEDYNHSISEILSRKEVANNDIIQEFLLCNSNHNDLPFNNDKFTHYLEKKEENLVKIKKSSEEQIKQQCTFQPELYKKNEEKRTFNKFYLDVLERTGKVNKKKESKAKKIKDNEEAKLLELREKKFVNEIPNYGSKTVELKKNICNKKNIEKIELFGKSIITKKISKSKKKNRKSNLNQSPVEVEVRQVNRKVIKSVQLTNSNVFNEILLTKFISLFNDEWDILNKENINLNELYRLLLKFNIISDSHMIKITEILDNEAYYDKENDTDKISGIESNLDTINICILEFIHHPINDYNNNKKKYTNLVKTILFSKYIVLQLVLNLLDLYEIYLISSFKRNDFDKVEALKSQCEDSYNETELNSLIKKHIYTEMKLQIIESHRYCSYSSSDEIIFTKNNIKNIFLDFQFIKLNKPWHVKESNVIKEDNKSILSKIIEPIHVKCNLYSLHEENKNKKLLNLQLMHINMVKKEQEECSFKPNLSLTNNFKELKNDSNNKHNLLYEQGKLKQLKIKELESKKKEEKLEETYKPDLSKKSNLIKPMYNNDEINQLEYENYYIRQRNGRRIREVQNLVENKREFQPNSKNIHYEELLSPSNKKEVTWEEVKRNKNNNNLDTVIEHSKLII